MRHHFLATGFAVMFAIGIWQARAQQGADSKPANPPEAAALVKHGSYLVNEVAHCSNCHTPHDAQGKLDRSRLLQGAILDFGPKNKTEEWAEESPDITAAGLAGQWSEAEMMKFLTSGLNPKGQGPMLPMPVFHLTDRDARAVTLYLRSLPGAKGRPDGKK